MVDLASTFSIDFFHTYQTSLKTHTHNCVLKFKKWQKEKIERWGRLPQQGCRNDDGGNDNGCFVGGGNGTIMWVVTCDEIAT